MENSGPERKRRRINSPEDEREACDESAPTLPLLCARWCQVLSQEDNETHDVQWDSTKIKCFLSQEDLDDTARMRRLVGGTADTVKLASKFHPLVFEHSIAGSGCELRSLPFFEALTADGDDGDASRRYRTATADEKRIVALGVRDLYLAAMHGLLDKHEKGLLNRLVNVVDESLTVGCTEVDGMMVSFHPSAAFRTLRFIERLDTKLQDQGRLPFFAQVLGSPKLYAVFVNPAELSFRNFENIVPLDRWMEAQQPSPSIGVLALELVDFAEVQPGRDVWTAKLRGADAELVRRVSDLDLYVSPPNKAVRGGERFIFHSAILSKALTKAASESSLFSRLAGGSLSPGDFALVNYVFRCNRFAPGDAKFAAHRDTPYYDSSRSHVSKYTLLVYLSPGRNGEGVLTIDGDCILHDIEQFTCVIFDQRYEHEGRQFIDPDKIFLRTELVFKDTSLAKNSQAASLFNEACYMTAESVFDEELTSYAHECFERANSLHWALEKTATEPPAYRYKQYRGIRFLTNGYDYLFAETKGGVIDCAFVAVLDYLNCKLGGKGPFRSLCRSTTIREVISSTSEAFQLLSSREPNRNGSYDEATASGFRRLAQDDVKGLLTRTPSKPFFPRPKPSWWDEDEDDEEEDANGGCCPFHAWTTFDAWKNDEVEDEYRKCWKFSRKRLFGTPLLLLGRELVINETQVEIAGDRILFHDDSDCTEPTRFNFAACWGGADVDAELYIDVDKEIPAPKLLVPPVVFHEYPGLGYHLVLDFFRNDWMVQIDHARMVPVPVITNDVSEDMGEHDPKYRGPFWQRVKELAGGNEEELQGSIWDRDSEGEETADED
ncbi:Prolyl 4-hydroxylase alpha subunit Fe(2+) 2OG dioxygenase domain-containing protein [Madurella fahalii]|uniref:Prolyl 4-hydroxylase alpha subunit Fe(2+) 2OG dioxygenase domain-containing protein n=1 Tax=Madurella fahalii TaxID=1157608 RepID=A0ABQ0GFZ3_9PEZI